MKNLFLNGSLLFLFFGSCSLQSIAQKVPSVQKISVKAPENTKIDGKTTEWGNTFAAFNANNHIFYTIANDDKMLYLVIHTKAENTINKIYIGGITFTLSPISTKRHEKKKDVAITYPVIGPIVNGVYLHAAVMCKDLQEDTIENKKKLDALILAHNKAFSSSYNMVGVNGIEGTDPIISVYNTESIKVKALFDHKFAFTYELGVPLKYLGQVLNETKMFKYNIKLNGPYRNGVDPYPPVRPGRNPSAQSGAYAAKLLYLQSQTDFGGECVLAN